MRKPIQSKKKAVDADRAKLMSIEYCLFHYPTLYTGGVPAALAEAGHWLVPIMLEDPDAGISAQAGELRIDAQTGDVISATPRDDVVAVGEKRYKEKRHARAAAYDLLREKDRE
jgi:hypothetical protein